MHARFYITKTEPEALWQHALAERIMAAPLMFVERTALELERVIRGDGDNSHRYSRDKIA